MMDFGLRLQLAIEENERNALRRLRRFCYVGLVLALAALVLIERVN